MNPLVIAAIFLFVLWLLVPSRASGYGAYAPWGPLTAYGPGYGIDGLYKLAVPPCMKPEGCVALN